ncbi:MAG: 1-acyl-sn-glycerol-3-phosphate acyltransferase [Bacteroidetes bacterium]|nr:1-acyl-sn-glycerol-3-phosphate acyltransferase [Bacteroidota bacterium]
MKSLLSFVSLLLIKGISRLFYRYEIKWPNNNPDIQWDQTRLIVLLNHTSLLEILYLGFLPISFLRMLSKRMVAPGADKTLNRPFVGALFKIFSPGMVSISRKRDNTWQQFMDAIYDDSIIVIIPEGRMKRKNGLDLDGNKMTVKSGIADVLQGLQSGQMIIAYSGGLHHVHVPGEKSYHVFKTLKMNLETVDIADYKQSFGEAVGSESWRKKVIQDLQTKLETKLPVW